MSEKLYIATRDELLELISEGVRSSLEKLGFSGTGNNEDSPMTIEQAADFVGRSVGSLYVMVNKQQIPFFKKNGRLYFSRDELREWIRAGKVQTISEIKTAADERLCGKIKKGV